MGKELGFRAVYRSGDRVHDARAQAARYSGVRAHSEVGEEPAGFILGVPDINVALRHINGRLMAFGLPIGLLKLLYYKNRTRTARLIALGVIEKYRRSGIAEM